MDSELNSVLIRTASESDIDGLTASSAGLAEDDGALRDPLRDPQWPRLHAAQAYTAHLTNPDSLVLVAVHEDEVVGHLLGGYSGSSDMWLSPRAQLISMFIQSRWRGDGVGSRLVEAFMEWARGRGAVQVRVTAYAANEGAIRFYQRHGFSHLESTFAIPLSGPER